MSVTYFDTGVLTLTSFAEGEVEKGVVKNALVAVEGSFKDSSGTPHVFTPERLYTIAEHTNMALNQGVQIPVCKDHKKDMSNVVGHLDDTSEVYVKRIEFSDLPNPKPAPELLGKLGLFMKGVAIKASEAVEQVKSGIAKYVSMGLNLDPKEHRIMELSLVSIPAIKHMSLFSARLPVAKFSDAESNVAITWEQLEESQRSIDDLKENYEELTGNLWTILENIYSSPAVDLGSIEEAAQYVMAGLNGFAERIMALLELEAAQGDANGTRAPEMGAQEQMMMQQQMQQEMGQQGEAAAYSRYTRIAKFKRACKYKRARAMVH